MRFTGMANDRLTFARVRELHQEDQLSPDGSHVMTLDPAWVSSVAADGIVVWRP